MYKILCVDDQHHMCHVDLEELITHILKKIPNQFITVDKDAWMGSPDLYFKEAVEIPTNIGTFKKLNDIPALVAFALLHNGDGAKVGNIIFVSKDSKGVAYLSPNTEQHLDYKEYNGWFYNISKESVRLKGVCPIRQFSNIIFGTEEKAVEALIQSSCIKPATYISEFNKEGNYLATFGSLEGSDNSKAPIIFDNEGNIYCKKLIETGGKD